ncbi:Hypp5043 [Branchiostoma lanceolatum]|uniref:Hypp5043 protein n=1 Tax=Branchiostoma lanceolatum TaxID=7740 RepID=A0A8K0ABV5_BRALA|nr:Hypp5043 [Branchiostoma lanceolatum]
MTTTTMPSLADRLQQLQLCLKADKDPQRGYERALRDAIVRMDPTIEMEVLKSLGDLYLQRGRVSRSSAEFDKAAGLYVAVLKNSTDPDMGQTLVHRLRYVEKLSKTLLNDYAPNIQSLLSNGKQPDTDSILRVATTFNNLDLANGRNRRTKENYTETLVNVIATGDELLVEEALKSLGDWYLEDGNRRSDAAQVMKAGAMYNKALARCAEPQQRQTLQHRVVYTERVRAKVTRRSLQTAATEQKEDRGWIDISETLSSQKQSNIEESWEQKFTDHMEKGNSSLQKAKLNTAEEHFAAALKLLHQKAQQYQREVEPLFKLGDVYSKRGQQTGDGGDFVKAAALYSAAIARSKDEVTKANLIETACKEAERSFLKHVLGTDKCMGHEGNEKHKKQLKEMRDQIKLEMESIDQQLDPYVYDEDDPCVKDIEAKRAQAVRHLFERIAQQRKEFIRLLVEECIGLMGPPPCQYALIGLGSQATGLVTPYSDLEFAILVAEEVEGNLMYFKQLTHFLHLKVVNLGETILPAVGIKSLNDFYSENPLDSWYYDSVTPRGFAFDGSMPKASKTPLGRQGTSKLIRTPTNMVTLIQKDVAHYLDKGYHLASILRNPCLMVGDQALVDEYAGIVVGLLKADGGKMALLEAQDTLQENMSRYEKQELTAKLTDVKKEIYRFPSMIVEVVALSAEHVNIASSLNNLGTVTKDLGNNRGAISYFEQALKMLKTIYGQSTAHHNIAMSFNNLGTAWKDLGDHWKGIIYHEQALQMLKAIYGHDNDLMQS